jgi:Flp pilus assembly pilin Flp
MDTLKRFWGDESGPELVEWAVVTIILLVAAVILYIAVGKVLGGVICSIFCWLNMVRDSTAADSAQRTTCDGKTREDCGT